MQRLEPDSAITGRIDQIRELEQDPYERARLAGADILALSELFDECVATIWTLHAQQRGAKTIADTLCVPVSMLASAIARSQRVHVQPVGD